MKRNAAFTLPELLVTIVIVILIFVFGFEALQRASVSALVPQHISNHRIIASALLAYGAEHQGLLPWGHDTSPSFSPNSAPYSKTLVIHGYISDPMVFVYPLQWRVMSDAWRSSWKLSNSNAARLHSSNPWPHTGYAVNRYGAMPSSGDGRQRASIPRISGDGALSELMLLRDSYNPQWDTPTELRGGGHAQFHRLDAFLPSEKMAFNGRIYATFADGHIQSYTREELLSHPDPEREAPLFRNRYTRP